ncbi:Uncharacterised protein [Klebsiella michiganensis]|uniref:Uncharacterized protein n=1 Tax=Klebsiella michiganensis TaxID=1134687 RepID=A0A7H4MZC7_9ENTR|nr:Uncharacterised protein [Klebsiella michiganensis]
MISGGPLSGSAVIGQRAKRPIINNYAELLIQELNVAPQQLQEESNSDPGGPGLHKINEMVTLVS